MAIQHEGAAFEGLSVESVPYHGARYGWANERGWGFCHDCVESTDRVDAYTAEDDEVCERCGRLIVSVKHPHNTKSSERPS